MNDEARDALLIGAFFIAYGLLSWYASGRRLVVTHVPTRTALDTNRLGFVASIKDRLLLEENSDGS